MSTLQDTFNAFFSKAVDGATGHAECQHCKRNSGEGGGKWYDSHTAWVCGEHIQAEEEYRQRRQEDKSRQKREHILRVFGTNGRGYLVRYEKPGETIEEDGEIYKVAKATYSPGGPNPNTEENDPAGWYIKVKE